MKVWKEQTLIEKILLRAEKSQEKNSATTQKNGDFTNLLSSMILKKNIRFNYGKISIRD